MTNQGKDENQMNTQGMWLAAARNHFDRGLSGWRLAPPLAPGIENQYFSSLFGDHNRDFLVFHDHDQSVVGLKLLCQCSNCVLAQAEFVLSRRSELVGMGAGAVSIMFSEQDPSVVEFVQRSRSLLEEAVEERRDSERKQDLQEKAELRSQITKLERRFADLVTETRGLVRDHKGQLWTRSELIQLSQQQQRED